jgi:hypothetical protein
MMSTEKGQMEWGTRVGVILAVSARRTRKLSALPGAGGGARRRRFHDFVCLCPSLSRFADRLGATRQFFSQTTGTETNGILNMSSVFWLIVVALEAKRGEGE